MSVLRFSLSSDQLELLLAFEECRGLSQLAESMGRDPSVISRSLQRLAEDFPVLLKVKGRWEITPLGKKTNELTREFVMRQESLFANVKIKPGRTNQFLAGKTALVIINAQQGLLDATQLGRNNSDAEKNIASILKRWRHEKLPVIHVRHVSENPSSMFYRGSSGSDFLADLAPTDSEEIVEKSASSGFSSPQLESLLKKTNSNQILLVGFTANECIDATARDASALGFSTYVAGDATAMFDMKSSDGKLLKADRVHKLTLANINAYYARVLNSADFLESEFFKPD